MTGNFIAGSNCLPGHPFVLHVAEEGDDPEQSVPPFSGPSFDLVRVLVPEPQDLEQEPHDPHTVHVHATEIDSIRSTKSCSEIASNYFDTFANVIL